MPDLFVLPLRLQSHLVALELFGSRLRFLNSFRVFRVFRGHLMRRNSEEGPPVVTQAWLRCCPRLIHRPTATWLLI
jgi:hypothetical protein